MRIGVKNGKEANKAGERQTEEEIIFEAKKNTDRGLEE